MSYIACEKHQEGYGECYSCHQECLEENKRLKQALKLYANDGMWNKEYVIQHQKLRWVCAIGPGAAQRALGGCKTDGE